MDQIDVVRFMRRVSDHWYILVGFMIIGGLTGLLISLFKPPVYESSAVFSVAIDYTQTGALTDIQEDQAMRAVGSVILSEQVISATLAQINNENGLGLKPSDFHENSYLDREDFRWTLRYRDRNPENSQLIISAWSKNADLTIQEALSHSLTSGVLLATLKEMTDCLKGLPDGKGLVYCGFQNLETLIDQIAKTSSQIQKEKVAGLGLFDFLSVSLLNKGAISNLAVLEARNSLVMSGAFIGLTAGLIFTSIWIMKRSPSI